jgi:hypothetical protein
MWTVMAVALDLLKTKSSVDNRFCTQVTEKYTGCTGTLQLDFFPNYMLFRYRVEVF